MNNEIKSNNNTDNLCVLTQLFSVIFIVIKVKIV